MTAYLNHITLDTGHIRRSPRGEVSDQVLMTVGAHLRRALSAGSDPIPDLPYDLKAASTSAFLLGTIMDGSLPVLTFGVAPRSRGAAHLWTMLVAGRDYPVARSPAAPWCAVRFDRPDLVVKIGDWAADYERLVSWAWIEGRADA